jgi:hypothetical protein
MTIETPYSRCKEECRIFDYNTGESKMAKAPGSPKKGKKISPSGTRKWGKDIIRATQKYLQK